MNLILATALCSLLSLDIARDEQVIFFPTAGHRNADGSCVVPVHGWIFEPEKDDFLRRRALAILRDALQLQPGDEKTRVFESRARAFLVDNERGKTITILLGGKDYRLGPSKSNGHFVGTLTLKPQEAKRLGIKDAAANWITFEAVARPGDNRRFKGKALLLADSGLSVISDIDDTIKVSEVARPDRLLANTFLGEYRAVPGMAKKYRAWAKQGAAFHYVSDSPWQLYEPLAALLRDMNFPAGTIHLKHFRWKDESFCDLFTVPEQRKIEAIEPILRAHAGRNFILVGDTGQNDPEVYGLLGRKYPGQIHLIELRNLTGESRNGPRMRRCFEGLPRDRWRLFDTN